MAEEGSRREVVIPEEYRNRLYEWVVDAPFDGCFWKKSHGAVDANGDFHPLTAAGRDLDDFTDVAETAHGLRPAGGWSVQGWNARMLAGIKARHGFGDVELPVAQVARARNLAIESVFGKPWFRADEAARDDERVKAAVADAERRLREYDAEVAEHLLARQNRLNALFLGAALDETPEDWKSWSLGADDVKESCRRFCSGCGDDAGVMCAVLDGLLDLGYDAWCTCSDCGEQFRPTEYGSFGALLDPEAYHGNGGIGVVMTRVQCGRCHAETECPKCGRPDLPPHGEGEHRYGHYTDAERFLGQWAGVCRTCIDRFFRERGYSHWRDEVDGLAAMFDADASWLNGRVEAMKADGEDPAAAETHRASLEKELREKWRKAVNALRDRMEDDVEEHFGIVGISTDRLDEGDTDYVYN